MVEILKHGNLRSKVECPNCHCVFAFDDTDIVRTRHSNLSSVIICPECTYNIDPIFAEPLENKD